MFTVNPKAQFFTKKFIEIFIKDQDSSNFTGGLDKGGTGQRRIR